jgi:hypothetical protein
MARQRRGGGLRPPELRGTLGTLLRTTLAQAGVVRDAIERGAREGRSRLDDLRSNRRRHDALAELGDLVLDLIRRGEIDLAELPEVAEVVAHLDEIDGSEREPESREVAPPARPRNRFDARGDRDDGTVASSRWSPAPAKRESARVWRPLADPPTEPAAPRVRADRATKPTIPDLPERARARRGGISFEEDDLASYMHPDDVKPHTDDES